MLSGLSHRLVCLGLPPPEILMADNCCQVRNSMQKVFPNIDVMQDVWHFLMRYVPHVVMLSAVSLTAYVGISFASGTA